MTTAISNKNSTSSKSSNSEWEEYTQKIATYHSEKCQQNPGYFSKSIEQRYYDQCCSHPLTTQVLLQMPILTLPLRINLIRSEYIGCSLALNHDSVQKIVNSMNEYWFPQARIRFQLVHVIERFCGHHVESSTGTDGAMKASSLSSAPELLPMETQKKIQSFLSGNGTIPFQRGNKEMNMEHRKLFLKLIFPLFDYNIESETNVIPNIKNDTYDYYDIWFFDMIGNTLQGQCIHRQSHTIIMGERSTKGYDVSTPRPHECLAKTMAHELGHALGLGHPKNRVFDDGQSQIITTGGIVQHADVYDNDVGGKRRMRMTSSSSERGVKRKVRNLMTGGMDKKGGGGWFLEQWQICVARSFANDFSRKM